VKGLDFSQKLAENAKRLKLRPEGFGEELVKIGFTLEGMYGTPGEGGMCTILHFQARSTLTANQGSNVPCMLITSRHQPSYATSNQCSGDSTSSRCSTTFEKDDNCKGGCQVLADQELLSYGYIRIRGTPAQSCDLLFCHGPLGLSSIQNLDGLDR